MSLQQNRTSDTSLALVFSKWAENVTWDLNSKELFYQDLKALYELGKREGYDAAKAQVQKFAESL